jgi:hypothetical protein
MNSPLLRLPSPRRLDNARGPIGKGALATACGIPPLREGDAGVATIKRVMENRCRMDKVPAKSIRSPK